MFVTAGVADTSLEEVISASLPWLLILLAVLLMITYVPWISLVIPNLLLDLRDRTLRYYQGKLLDSFFP